MSSALKQLVKAFGEEVGKLRFRLPVSYVYNPLDYAWAGQEAFLDKFFPFDAHGEVERPTLLVSMNPGPHGMSQSGKVANETKRNFHFIFCLEQEWRLELQPLCGSGWALICHTMPSDLLRSCAHQDPSLDSLQCRLHPPPMMSRQQQRQNVGVAM